MCTAQIHDRQGSLDKAQGNGARTSKRFAGVGYGHRMTLRAGEHRLRDDLIDTGDQENALFNYVESLVSVFVGRGNVVID